MLLARANAALREVGLCSRNRLSPRIGLRCLAPLVTASSTTSELGHDDQANFSRSNSSVPSEWIPPKIGDTTNQRDWIVPGVHVLWDDVSQMRLRRRTKLLWTSAPRTVLLVKKCSDERVTAQMLEIATWLTARGVRVLVEENVQVEMPDYDSFSAETGLPRPDFAGAEDSVVKHITVAPSALLTDDRHSATVTLGGDGTLLHLANLFNGDCEERSARPPPVVSFGMGTLGFLTPFDVANYKEILGCILRANSAPIYATLRTRLRCEVTAEDGELIVISRVMNECVIDCESHLSLCTLETAVDGHHVTTVHGDGLIVSTPSGSTAYNLSAGGALVAPSVPCTLLTPIAPHSLASRPFIVPESSYVEVTIPDSMHKSGTRATFDGRTVVALPVRSKVAFMMASHPIPIINMNRHDMDWFNSLTTKLRWSNNMIH